MKDYLYNAWKRFIRQKIAVKVSACLMVLLMIASVTFIYQCYVSKIADHVELVAILLNTLVAVLGFYAIYASIQNDSEAKQFEFYADYNFNFLTNPEFILVERMLESCNQEYERINSECNCSWNSEQEVRFQKFCDAVFGTKEYKYVDKPRSKYTRVDKNKLISKEYQMIVNYLVYLESFVPLILNEQLYLEDVDDLFGYRYFIAMHNPVLQEMELFRERPYYRGCFKAYDKWVDYRRKKRKKEIKKELKNELREETIIELKKELNSNSFSYLMPMEHYDLNNGWKKYKTEHLEARV